MMPFAALTAQNSSTTYRKLRQSMPEKDDSLDAIEEKKLNLIGNTAKEAVADDYQMGLSTDF